MKTAAKIKSLSRILYIVLIAAVVLTGVLAISGCKDGKTDNAENAADTAEAASGTEAEKLGEGAKNFFFSVVDAEGKTVHCYEISTDADTVGKALQDLGLIEGNDGPYGLYVEKVCGIEALYEKDGTYWAFYKGDDYSMTGVDTTEIEIGAAYSFKVEK